MPDTPCDAQRSVPRRDRLPDACSQQVTQISWLHVFSISQLLLLFISLIMTVWIHNLMRFGKKNLALSIDSTARVLVPVSRR